MSFLSYVDENFTRVVMYTIKGESRSNLLNPSVPLDQPKREKIDKEERLHLEEEIRDLLPLRSRELNKCRPLKTSKFVTNCRMEYLN